MMRADKRRLTKKKMHQALTNDGVYYRRGDISGLVDHYHPIIDLLTEIEIIRAEINDDKTVWGKDINLLTVYYREGGGRFSFPLPDNDFITNHIIDLVTPYLS